MKTNEKALKKVMNGCICQNSSHTTIKTNSILGLNNIENGKKTYFQMCKIAQKKNLFPLYLSLGSSRIISITKTRIKSRKRHSSQERTGR